MEHTHMADSWNCIYAFTFSKRKSNCQTGTGLSSTEIKNACFRCATARVRGQIDTQLKYDDFVGQVPSTARMFNLGVNDPTKLEWMMKTELKLARGGAIGQRLFEHFASGAARLQPYVWHRPDGYLGKLIAKSPPVVALYREVMALVRQQKGRLRPLRFPWTMYATRFARTFAFIGGTSGIRVFLSSQQSVRESHSCVSLSPMSKRVAAVRLRVQFCDEFGVEKEDLYSPGLSAFWRLQHATGDSQRYRPFVNIFGIEKSLNVPL